MDPWVRGRRGRGPQGILRLRGGPRTRWAWEGSLQQGILGKLQGRLRGGMHLDPPARTSRFLRADIQDKQADFDMHQGGLRGQRERVRLGKGQGLRGAVLELLQGDNARGTEGGTARETGLGLQG